MDPAPRPRPSVHPVVGRAPRWLVLLLAASGLLLGLLVFNVARSFQDLERALAGGSPALVHLRAFWERTEGRELLLVVAASSLVLASLAVALRLFRVLRRSQKALGQTEDRYRALAENTGVGIWQTDASGRSLYLNPAMCRLLEIEHPSEAAGRSLGSFFTPESLERIAEQEALRHFGISSSYEVELVTRRGNRRQLLIWGSPVLEESGSLGSMIGTCIDITERKLAEARLEHQALYDSVTGLPNRVLVLDRLERANARLRRRHTSLALLFVDLDRFKMVNDALGHAAGDGLLSEVGRRLLGSVREQDTVARLGGDEFAILLEEPCDEDGLQMVVERVLEVVRRPVVVEGHELRTSASLGAVLVGQHHVAAEAILKNADIAMYVAKREGGDRCHVYDPGEDAWRVEHLELEQGLWLAAERGELFLEYQPLLHLSTERIVGMEALVRWRHPERGLLEPAEFIPIAEESGAVVPLGRWVLEEACRHLRAWHELSPALGALQMSVNVSSHQLRRPQLVEEVEAALEAAGLGPAALQLEITETALLDSGDVLERLRRLGVTLAVDDFGSGYSVLGALKRVSAQVLKIDRSFISGLTDSLQDAAITAALVELGQALRCSVVAEGIETREQLEALRRLRCAVGQGFLFSRPLAAAEMEELLVREVERAARSRGRRRQVGGGTLGPVGA